MCKGGEEIIHRADPTRPDSTLRTRANVPCELCDARASIYCPSDNAYLCGKCDKWVHGANFLAQRHARCSLCDTCQRLTGRYVVGASSDSVVRSGCNSEANNKCFRNRKRLYEFI